MKRIDINKEWCFTYVKGILHLPCDTSSQAPYSLATKRDGICFYCKKEVPKFIMIQHKLLYGE